MTLFFKKEDEGIEGKKHQNNNHPVFPSLNTSSLTHSSLAASHIKSENAWFCFTLPLDRSLLRDRADAKILQLVTF